MPEQQIPQPQQMPELQQQPAGKQIIIEKERVSLVKSFLRLLVTTIIIVCIAAVCYGIWRLINYSLSQGWL